VFEVFQHFLKFCLHVLRKISAPILKSRSSESLSLCEATFEREAPHKRPTFSICWFGSISRHFERRRRGPGSTWAML
jgi:hypothetical protein